MEEVKNYLEERIEFIVRTRGKETTAEKELQKVLDLVNSKMEEA